MSTTNQAATEAPDAELIRQQIQAEINLANQNAVFTRPWHEGWEADVQIIEDDQSYWLLTMVDLMTLLLTLFVLLAAYAYQSKDATIAAQSSSGSAVQAQAKVDRTPTPQTGPIPTTATSPGETPTQGNIPQAGNALIGKAGTSPLESHPLPPTATRPDDPPVDNKTTDQQARNLFAGLGQDVDVSVVKGRVNLRVKDNILFSSGDAALSGPVQTLINKLADRLKSGTYPISVQGHTDDRPIHTLQYPSNWELSAARAASVVQQLISQGVQPGRLSAVGYADTHPLVPNTTSTERAENRRVDLELQLPAQAASAIPPTTTGTP
ncbi:MAG: OmpA family protein [Halothiobacillus sp.]|jgi:chemotaxis protein MotB|nr:OmpA family protein [Halothiobacillus sp.]